MKASFTMLQAILILVIAVMVIIITIPWSQKTIGISMDLTELKSIESQFDECNERIIETARTGSTNKCIFNNKRGEVYGKQEGIYYKLMSSAPICDESSLTEIDPKNHIWQSCTVSGEQRIYTLLWKFPASLNITGQGIEGNQMEGQSNVGNMNFENPLRFETLTLYVNFNYAPGQTGNIVELSRVEANQNNVTLNVKIS